MRCPKCNQIIPDNSTFCLSCGEKLAGITSREMPQTRTVTIKRLRKFVGCALVYQVFCDGQAVATLRNGETKVFEINEMPHAIQCYATVPTMVYGNGNGIYGGGGPLVSDLVNVSGGNHSIDLFVKNGFNSLKLEVVKIY